MFFLQVALKTFFVYFENALRKIQLNLFVFLFSTEVPVSSPVIHGLKPRYKVNDIVRGNCTSKYSRPAANLTWTINDIVVSSLFVTKLIHQQFLKVNFDSSSQFQLPH